MATTRPPFVRYPILTTPRLRLRPVTAADMPALLPITFYDGEPAESLAEAERMRRLTDADYRRGDLLHWGFELAGSRVLVGTGGFYRGFPDRVGEIGYLLLPAYQGHGYATEAATAMVRFGFATLRLRQVAAFTRPANAPSAAVLRRVGFRELPFAPPMAFRHFVLDRPGR